MKIMEVVMSQLEITEWIPKFVAALREAQAAGVKQISGRLGTPDGCRCAEGVIGDLLVTEGLMEVKVSGIDTDGDDWDGGAEAELAYRIVGPGQWYTTVLPMRDLFNRGLSARPEPGRDPRPVWELNDVKEMTFGEIADRLEAWMKEVS